MNYFFVQRGSDVLVVEAETMAEAITRFSASEWEPVTIRLVDVFFKEKK